MTEDLDLSEKHYYDVELHHEDLGDVGSGTLQFGASRWPTVSLGLANSAKFYDGQKLDRIKAKSSTGQIFSLFDCTFNSFNLFADYVIFGELEAPIFKRIDVRYSDVSEWFLDPQNIDGELGKELIWKNNSKPLSVEIKAGKQSFTIRSEYAASFQTLGEDSVLHEHVEFAIESTKDSFALIDLKRKAHELSCLFSLLIGLPISTLSVHIVTESGDRKFVYYPGVGRPARTTSEDGLGNRGFIRKIAVEDRWQVIFEKYYQSKYREVIWVRLAGMLGYKGFWEYRTLGYVSLLDQYTAQFVTRAARSAVPLVDPQVIAKLKIAVDLLSPPIDASERSQLLKAVEHVSKNLTGRRSLRNRYLLTLQQTDPNVVAIINISLENFDFIKELRDRVAHGNDHGIEGYDFTRSEMIVTKIALLLTYWAFIDFGLQSDDFLRCLSTTHNRLCMAAQPDRVHLARVTKPEIFFRVSAANLAEIKQTPRIKDRPCFTRSEVGGLCFSAELTQRYKTATGASAVNPIPADTVIFGVPPERIRFFGTTYIESDVEHLELHWVHIIEGPINGE